MSNKRTAGDRLFEQYVSANSYEFKFEPDLPAEPSISDPRWGSGARVRVPLSMETDRFAVPW
jgi:hypothetical protein